MLWGMLEVFENAEVGFVSAKRKEIEEASSAYQLGVEISYMSLPEGIETLIIVDPMLATGSTLEKVIRKIKETLKLEKLIVSTLISTKVGIERVFQADSTLQLYTFSVDPGLNSRAFIVPGLGDAGDRAFS